MVRRHRERTAVLWHLHTPVYRGIRATLRNAVKFGLVGRTVDAIVASGPDPAEGVIRVGAPRRRVEVAGTAVETDRFPLTTAEARSAARARLELPSEARVLLHLGWDWQLKDGDLFLATVREMLSRDSAAPLLGLTVGGGDPARQAISRLGLEGGVRVAEPLDDVDTLYAAADLFVSSSRVEGQPFAVIEALCTGLPVVATDLPGHRRICDGLAGCRVVGRSPEALAAAAEELLHRDPAEAAGDAERGRASMVERFDLAPWTDRMFARYERCLAGHGDPGSE
jgi:glycosyltransferase involved in cell wall biosynthesis